MYKDLANNLRYLSALMIHCAKSGHTGMPLGFADVMIVLYKDFLYFDPLNPKNGNRDRFVLSAGHGSALLYAALFLSGYQDVTLDDLRNFRQINSPTAGHPEFGSLDGIETTTDPLGQGRGKCSGNSYIRKNKKFKA